MSLASELRRAANNIGGELAVTLEQAAHELDKFELHKSLEKLEQTFENRKAETASGTRHV
tara:strand:+ start:500 stop:679 length:180 start_codon:yes stop_codon:yes gene_type:complete